MDHWTTNPFQVLTFIVAPAILTNASSVMALGTSNRFARALDRARILSSQVRGRESEPDPEIALHIRQIRAAETRILLLVRALTAFYLSVGSFAAASLVSLMGAVFFVAHQETLRHITLIIALCAGFVGVSGLRTARVGNEDGAADPARRDAVPGKPSDAPRLDKRCGGRQIVSHYRLSGSGTI